MGAFLEASTTTLKLLLLINFIIGISYSQEREKLQASQGLNFTEKQLQILKLFNNLNCLKTADKDLLDISNSFDPLNSLHLYQNPEVVQDFFTNVKEGKYLGRFDIFTNEGSYADQMLQLFDILFFIDSDRDWDLFYKTAAYSVTRVNTAKFAWVLGSILSTKLTNFKSPPYYEVFPQMFTPKWIIQQGNGEEGHANADNGDPENVLSYFRHDPSINAFHLAWHVDFPYWWLPTKYGMEKDRKGELFLYMHHQLINRYKAERLSNGMKETMALILDQPIEEGYIPVTLNINFKEYPPRQPNTTIQTVGEITVMDLQIACSRISDGISKGYFVTTAGEEISIRSDAGAEILGATIEASQQSVNPKYYSSLHNQIHRLLSRSANPDKTLNIPPDTLIHPETTLQDPAFYRIHTLLDAFHQAEKYQLSSYTQKDLEFSDVDINFVKLTPQKIGKSGKYLPLAWPFQSIPVLSTFFEDFKYDITNAIKSCDDVNSGANFSATITRLNHVPFEYQITAFSHKSGNTRGVVRIYMSPVNGYDGKPFSNEKLHWNMIEMDRFPVTLKQGQNVIQRFSQNSSVTLPDRPGFAKLFKEVKDRMSQQDESPYSKNVTRQCGFPNNLLLPRGTKEGMSFRMFVIITPTSAEDYDENQFPTLSMCGNPNGKFPDGKSMGFPFDRKVSFGFKFPWIIHQNYKFLDLIIRHLD